MGKRDYIKTLGPNFEGTSSPFPPTIMTISALSLTLLAPLSLASFPLEVRAAAAERPLPAKAQVIDQRTFNVLEVVPPPAEFNATSVSSRNIIDARVTLGR